MSKYFEAKHWTKLKSSDLIEWQIISKNFSPEELSSNGDGSVKISKVSLERLQELRDRYGKPLIINSAYRDPSWNRSEGGKPNSQHVQGTAFDIHIKNAEMGWELEQLAVKCGFTAIGRYNTFIHIDDRPPKANGGGYRWGKKWAV